MNILLIIFICLNAQLSDSLPIQKSNTVGQVIEKNEGNESKTGCSIVFADRKKGIESKGSGTLLLAEDGSARPTGSSNKSPIQIDTIIKNIMADYDEQYSKQTLEYTLIVGSAVSAETLKGFCDQLSAKLPDKISIVFYVELSK
jgi:hypothetical protein